ncbi:MAG TPA: LysR family transcriptional regulator [Stellaceae bacterium]|nr:LysR family transcriptional regulator [Stellaceae bacterium]
MTGSNASPTLDWDDVRVFLAVARHGSLRAAGRALGLSQPTIGRRLALFEATFGGPTLFDRLPEGLRLNTAGDALIAAAEELESAALALERRRAAASPALSGTVRVSVGEWGGSFLARHIDQSSETGLPPTLTLELVESWETANLARRDADLALRHGVPEGGNLYVSKVGVIACGVYRRRDGGGREALRGAAWVTYPEEQSHLLSARWVDQQLRDAGGRVALRASTLPLRADAVRAGIGVGLLPCYLGDADAVLERITPPVSELGAEYWVIVHRDLRRAACVRAVIEWIRRLFEERRDELTGTAARPVNYLAAE